MTASTENWHASYSQVASIWWVYAHLATLLYYQLFCYHCADCGCGK